MTLAANPYLQLAAAQQQQGQTPISVATSSHSAINQHQQQSQLASFGGLLQTPPHLGGLYAMNPGLLRLPMAAQQPALLPAGAGGLLQNTAIFAAQQRLLLQQQQQQQQLQLAMLQQQQQQRAQTQTQLAQYYPGAAAPNVAAASTGAKRSFDQAFAAAIAAQPGAGAAKRVYSASPIISANPTSYSAGGST